MNRAKIRTALHVIWALTALSVFSWISILVGLYSPLSAMMNHGSVDDPVTALGLGWTHLIILAAAGIRVRIFLAMVQAVRSLKKK